MKYNISTKALDFTISQEIGTRADYDRQNCHPCWPGGLSGITWGIGFDAGQHSAKQIRDIWGMKFQPAHLDLVCAVAGLKGEAAKNRLSYAISAITVPFDSAYEVFRGNNYPEYVRETGADYPGLDQLFPDAAGALVDLVYNRGAALKSSLPWHPRSEMASIADLISNKDYAGIAAQLRAMKRLWDGTILEGETQASKMTGLVNRREAEAVLVEKASHQYSQTDIITIEI